MEDNLPKFENREQLVISGETAANMRTAMSWAKFMAIVCFVMTGMIFVAAVILLAMGGAMQYYYPALGGGALLGICYLVIAVIYFFLSYFMYMFAVKTKRAIDNGCMQDLSAGTMNMKYYFKMTGIVTIVTIAVVVLMILFAAIGMAAFME